MEPIGGKILCDIQEDQDVWLVSAAGQELMTFETFRRAQEWRRTTAVYVHYASATGCRFYVKKDQGWQVRGSETDTWQPADNQPWVERQVSAWQATYQQHVQPLGAV